MKIGSIFESKPQKMANTLNQQYKSVFTTPSEATDITLNISQNGNSLSEISITEEDIKEAIDDISLTSAPGPDGITAGI